jgi:hypothetical protein
MRRILSFGLREASNLMANMDHFTSLASDFSGMLSGTEQVENLREYYEKNIVRRTEKTWMTDNELQIWCDVDVHVLKQTWGSTAGGWQGVGGASMTSSYTYIIENFNFGIAAIYYGNRFAYMVEIDQAYMDARGHLPGVKDLSLTTLKVICKSK